MNWFISYKKRRLCEDGRFRDFNSDIVRKYCKPKTYKNELVAKKKIGLLKRDHPGKKLSWCNYLYDCECSPS